MYSAINQIRLASMLRQTEVKAFKEVLQAPKKPLNSFSLFFQERFPTVKTLNPSKEVKDITKLIANEWKQLDSTRKATYQTKAQAELQKYQKTKEQFDTKLTPGHKLLQTLLRYNRRNFNSSGEERIREIKSSLRKFRSQFPEGPVTSRGLFLKEKLTGKKIEEKAGAEALAAWKSLSQQIKSQYEENARKSYEAYKAQIRLFTANFKLN